MAAHQEKYYSISRFPVDLRKGVKVAAALTGKSIRQYIVDALYKAVAKDGVVIEEED